MHDEITDLGNDRQWQPRPQVKTEGELYNGWIRVTTLKSTDKCYQQKRDIMRHYVLCDGHT